MLCKIIMLLFCFNSFLFCSSEYTKYPTFERLFHKILEIERIASKDLKIVQVECQLVAKSQFIAVGFVDNFIIFLDTQKNENFDFNYEKYTDKHKQNLASLLLKRSVWVYYEHQSRLRNEERCRNKRYIMDDQGFEEACEFGEKITEIDTEIQVIAADERSRIIRQIIRQKLLMK